MNLAARLFLQQSHVRPDKSLVKDLRRREQEAYFSRIRHLGVNAIILDPENGVLRDWRPH
jgi:hypothetical protein